MLYLGVIVIGRNEEKHLSKCFASLDSTVARTIYVDSGSTDSSVVVARRIGVITHELDKSRPFSAARARREGVDVLLNRFPDTEWIQFVDGDCSLDPEWFAGAAEAIASDRTIAIVCGQLSESAPRSSIYNRMNAVRWNCMPIGNVRACGGIFWIRKSVYEKVGGFRDELVTGEEAELCSRVLESGHKIVRLNIPMAVHESDMVSLQQWWKRAVWGGYGDALKFKLLRELCVNERKAVNRTLQTWVLALPLFMLTGLIGGLWSWYWLGLVVFGVAAYLLLAMRVTSNCLAKHIKLSDSILYAFLMILRRFPYALGYYKYRLSSYWEFQPPDPHACESN